MQPVHRTLLEVNEEFLLAETPTTPFLHALLDKHVLTDLDLQQLNRLEPQGPRAVKRFVLHVLPLRGPLAFPALLEALQEAKAQHLVDLLLEEEAVLTAAVKPIELPESSPESPPPAQDPNEYARKLSANRGLIEGAVKPEHVIAPLMQNGVLTALEEALLDTVKEQPRMAWTVLWGVLLQRGHKAYSAFMAALLQNGYSALFHTIEETKVTGVGAMKSALDRNIVSADNKTRAAEDHAGDTPGLPRSGDGPEAAPLRAGSRQSVAKAGSDEVPPGSAPRPHAGPLQPGYSQGDLDLLHAPRTETRVGDSGAPATVQVSERMFYNPAWTDPYNHLRGADVDSTRPVHRRTTSSRKSREVESASALSEQGDVFADDSMHRSPDHPRGDSTDDHDQRGGAGFASLEAISERDAESDAGSHAGDEETASAGRSEEGPDFRSSPENSTAHKSPNV